MRPRIRHLLKIRTKGSGLHRGTGVLLLGILMLGLAACARYQGDPRSADEHRSEALKLIFESNFQAAAAELELAVKKTPRDGDLLLLYGEILEAGGRPRDALAAYEKAKKVVQRSDPRHLELTYRLALIEAIKLDQVGNAEKRLTELPGNSIFHLDLQGVITLAQGKPREALLLYNQALQQKPHNDLAARILYHASLAYQRLGDEKNAHDTLYRAVNLAEDYGLAKDIEILYKQLNAGNSAH